MTNKERELLLFVASFLKNMRRFGVEQRYGELIGSAAAEVRELDRLISTVRQEAAAEDGPRQHDAGAMAEAMNTTEERTFAGDHIEIIVAQLEGLAEQLYEHPPVKAAPGARVPAPHAASLGEQLSRIAGGLETNFDNFNPVGMVVLEAGTAKEIASLLKEARRNIQAHGGSPNGDMARIDAVLPKVTR